MGRHVQVDFKEFRAFRDAFEQAGQALREDFIRECAAELAARLLRKAIKRTPVGQYPAGSGKTGGTLRRGWTAGRNAAEYAAGLPVEKRGDTYVVEITNPVEYASYVEYGHRTRGGNGFVRGRLMMTLSAQEIRSMAPGLLQKRLEARLREAFG